MPRYRTISTVTMGGKDIKPGKHIVLDEEVGSSIPWAVVLDEESEKDKSPPKKPVK